MHWKILQRNNHDDAPLTNDKLNSDEYVMEYTQQ
jgi:hypothetical protein